MNLNDVVKIALSNLMHRKVRSWLTLLGIFAGIAAIVALVGLGQGLETAITEQFASFGVNTVTITGAGSSSGPPGTNAVGTLNDRDIRLIEELPEVDYVLARYIRAVQLEYRDEVEVGFAASVPRGENGRRMFDLLNIDVEDGRLIGDGDENKIVLGATFDVEGEQPQVGQKVSIQGQTFSVAGITKKKGNPIFDNSIFLLEDSMKDILDLDEDYSFLVASVKEGEDIPATAAAIERRLRQDRNLKPGEEDFEVSSPQDSLAALTDILLIIQILLVGIAFISLIVGAIGILNTMYTAVLERRTEIGIMKSIGATNRDVLSIFLFESGLLGLAGGIIGLLIGVGIGKFIEFGAFIAFGENILKTTFPLWLILGSFTFAFLLGAIAGTWPAKQAAKLQPVDALRK